MNGKLTVQTAPQTISSYVGQPGFTGPVDLAYNTLTNGPTSMIINAFLDNRVSLDITLYCIPMSRKIALSTSMQTARGGGEAWLVHEGFCWYERCSIFAVKTPRTNCIFVGHVHTAELHDRSNGQHWRTQMSSCSLDDWSQSSARDRYKCLLADLPGRSKRSSN